MLHLQYGVLVNFPYYLFFSLKWSYDQYNQGHVDSLAHHGLIKLIVNHNLCLAQQALEWDAFVNQTPIENPQPPAANDTPEASSSKKWHLKPSSLPE